VTPMNTPFTYDFGYSWIIGWGYVVPLVLFGGLAVAAWRVKWRTWLVAVPGVIAAWSLTSMVLMQMVFGINLPQQILAPRFLASGSGEALDVGAGSGRSTVGLLIARPRVRVTAIDIYSGYFGIDDNTPERLMANARIAGVADRATVQVGDARAMPLPSGTYDGVISSYAIDHIRRDDIPKALAEVARVLKPRGEFLLMLVNVDLWTWVLSPPMAHHAGADPNRWRTLLESAGFEILEQGTPPMTLYYYARKSGTPPPSQ
jgi:SAM-dependent methyltransferase